MASNSNQADQLQDKKERPKLSKDAYKKAFKLLSYIFPYRWAFALGLLLLAFGSSIFMIFPIAAGELINVAVGESKYNLTFEKVGLLLAIVLVVQAVTSYLRVLLFTHVSERSMADIRKALYDKFIGQPIYFFEKNRVGELTSRTTADVQQLQDALSLTLAEFIRQIIVLLFGITYIAITAWKLTLIMLGILPVVIVVAMVFGRYIRKLSRHRQDEMAATNVILEETLLAISVVKSFTNEWFERVRYGRAIDKVVDISIKTARIRGLFIAFIISILFGAMFFVLWMGARMVESDPNFGVGDLTTFITITAIVGGSLASLGDFYTQLLKAVGSSERIMEFLEQPSEVEIVSDIERISIKGDIHFKEVFFSYPSRPEIEVLKGISFDVLAGQKVALVGHSGVGKSTIVQLLMRIYDLEKGAVMVDHKNILDFNISQLRQNIAIVPQDVILFGGSIRENIAYGNHRATEEEIIIAAQQANAMQFIEQFPEGLDTIVGERGMKLSGGQRQRIAIARAILKNPRILLLDEATSALDAESERLVQEALNNLMEGRTSIIIAHRLATIREVDRIYVLDQGQIVEAGSHEELTAMGEGIYNQLAKLQFEY